VSWVEEWETVDVCESEVENLQSMHKTSRRAGYFAFYSPEIWPHMWGEMDNKDLFVFMFWLKY
jgi:hypothetical protein